MSIYQTDDNQFDTFFDAAMLKHLDAWLYTAVDGDDCREEVRTAMLTYAAGDPEYWSAQSWPNLFDHAHCDAIVTVHRG